MAWWTTCKVHCQVSSLVSGVATQLCNNCCCFIARLWGGSCHQLHINGMLCFWISARLSTVSRIMNFCWSSIAWAYLAMYGNGCNATCWADLCVSLEGTKSRSLPVLSGVPQGSVLGPLLFLVYMNDLPALVKQSTIYMFADDVKCVRPIWCYSDCELLQNDLDSMSCWSTSWKLIFKVSKCTHLRICTSNATNCIDSAYIHWTTRFLSRRTRTRTWGFSSLQTCPFQHIMLT